MISIKIILAHPANFSKTQREQPYTDKYLKGVITIKVKERVGPFEYQRSNVNFGIGSLDMLVQKFSVSSLDKRFKHKPIPKESGLPALDRIYKIEFPEEKNVWEVVHAFAADHNVEYAEPVYIHYFSVSPNDPMYDQQQHLPQIMAEEAWDVHKGENGEEEVVVAIVDSGTDWLHPDLTENNWQNLGEDSDGDGVTLEFNNGVWERDPDDLNGIDDDNNGFIDDVIGWDFREVMNGGDGSNPDPYPDTISHGTHVSGIAAARTNNGVGISSISYNVKYMPVKVSYGMGILFGFEGVIYAAENGADIINLSWGGSFYSQAEAETIDYATGLGSIIVAAAGNGNTDASSYPAAYPGVLAVAAVTEFDIRAPFSNYGASVDIAAPGVNIISTMPNNNYASHSGTSMATPMVAGLFALLKSYHPDWTTDQLINQVIGTCDDIDALNTGYENSLGAGRINAYHALVDENVIPQQGLKLELMSYSVSDENGNGRLEPEESGSINLTIRNFAHLVSSDDVTFSVSSPSQEVTITSNTVTTSVPADDEFEITDAIEFTVNADASCSEVTFQVQVSSDIEITFGQVIYIRVIVAPSGIFVYDGIKNGPDHSGAFITQYLEEQGLEVLHSDIYPYTFDGFDAALLSFSNPGQFLDQTELFNHHHSVVIQEYLENGGKVYLEGGTVMFMANYFAWPNKTDFFNLFGVSDVYIDFFNPHPITSLEGQDGTLAEGMVFTESNQQNNWYIDQLIPAPDGLVPLNEDGLGNVSVYKEGDLGHKAFFSGYSLAYLVDTDPHSSRYHLMNRIMSFFGYSSGEGYVEANFTTDEKEVLPGEEVQFTDWSFSDEESTIESWAWDFDEDGIIDSDEQNPVWSYNSGGNYDVMLVVSNSQSIDTLIRKDVVLVRSGILVFEGEENGVDQSGSYIRNYLEDNGYEVAYANHFPSTLTGFDAVFASFGNRYHTSPKITNEIAISLYNYGWQGGNIYLEGADALGTDQTGNIPFWAVFGVEQVDDGSMNSIDKLQGQDGTIMDGMEFNVSNQFDVNSIDIYQPYQNAIVGHTAFEESDYGSVAVQFDGSLFSDQKTFCMSYSVANLEDGEYPNTRNELLNRILEFFNPTTGIHYQANLSENRINLYPNPARNHLVVAFDLDEESGWSIEIYNLTGQKVMYEPQKMYTPGRNEIHLTTDKLNSGTYLYRLISSTEVFSGKLLTNISHLRIQQ